MFLYELNKQGVTIERMKNKQGKVYGLKFSYGEYAFKASEVGREFGYRSLQKNFEASRKAETNVSDQVIRKSSENTDTMETGYQLVPQAVHIPTTNRGSSTNCKGGKRSVRCSHQCSR